MPLPADYQTVTVHGKWVRLDGTPETGSIKFTPTQPVIVDASEETVVVGAGGVTAALGPTGEITANIPSTDDPDVEGTPFTYHVVVSLSDYQYDFDMTAPLATVGTLEIATLTPTIPAPPPTATYVQTIDGLSGIVTSDELDILRMGLLADRPDAVTSHVRIYVTTDEQGGPRTYISHGGVWVNIAHFSRKVDVSRFGINGDAKFRTTGALAAGASQLSAPSEFTQADVDAGHILSLEGAGPGGATLNGAIISVSGGKATINATASVTVTAQNVVWGKDDADGWDAARIFATASSASNIVENRTLTLAMQGGGSLTSRQIKVPQHSGIDGAGQRASWIAACAPLTDGSGNWLPLLQYGDTAPTFAGIRGGTSRDFLVHGMKQCAGVFEGSCTQVGFDSIEVEHTAPGAYGWRYERGQNNDHRRLNINNTGGNDVEFDSGAGGSAWYKCELNYCGVGSDTPRFFNLSVRQTTTYQTGGYKKPTDHSFRDCILERGDTQDDDPTIIGNSGKRGCMFIGAAGSRFLFDGCTFAMGADRTAVDPGTVRANVLMMPEDIPTGAPGVSVDFVGCQFTGTEGVVQVIDSDADGITDKLALAGWSHGTTVYATVLTLGCLSGTGTGTFTSNAIGVTPPATPFDVVIGTERLTISGLAGTTWTVSARGVSNQAGTATTAAAHSIADSVYQPVENGTVAMLAHSAAKLNTITVRVNGYRVSGQSAWFVLDDDVNFDYRSRGTITDVGSNTTGPGFLNAPRRITAPHITTSYALVATAGAFAGTGTGTFVRGALAANVVVPATPFDVVVENERVTISTVAGTTWTISARGVNNSTAIAHAVGVPVFIAGGIYTRSAESTKTWDQVMLNRSMNISRFRTDGTYTDTSAGSTSSHQVLEGDLRRDERTQVRMRDGSGNWPVIASPTRALILGLGGSVATTLTDTADFLMQVPYAMTLQKMKVTAKGAPTGAMAVQLRRSTNSTTPLFSDVTGFLCTFVSGQSSAVADPTDVDVNEGDLLNFSVATGSGTNLLVEIVTVAR